MAIKMSLSCSFEVAIIGVFVPHLSAVAFSQIVMSPLFKAMSPVGHTAIPAWASLVKSTQIITQRTFCTN